MELTLDDNRLPDKIVSSQKSNWILSLQCYFLKMLIANVIVLFVDMNKHAINNGWIQWVIWQGVANMIDFRNAYPE